MRIYVAAPWRRRDEAKAFASRLAQLGHTITEPWWLYETQENTTEEKSNRALADLKGVLDADAVVLLNLEKSEGKAVETGIALGLGIPVLLVGKPTNIFHYLDYGITLVPDVDSAIRTLTESEATFLQDRDLGDEDGYGAGV